MFDFRNLASQINYSMKKQKHQKQNCQKEGRKESKNRTLGTQEPRHRKSDKFSTKHPEIGGKNTKTM
jgi:hypothetical protein